MQTLPPSNLIFGLILLCSQNLLKATAFAVVNYKSGTSRRKREAVRGNIRVWNNAVIPYVISENLGKYTHSSLWPLSSCSKVQECMHKCRSSLAYSQFPPCKLKRQLLGTSPDYKLDDHPSCF